MAVTGNAEVSMKKSVSVLLLSVLSLFAVSCATTQTAQETPRFHEGRHANVVLRFSSWDYTFMSKPFYAEDGFMQQVKRENLGQVLGRFQVGREMAVVVIGVQYNGAQLDEIVSGWKKCLGDCGFKRVVILRAGRTTELNGSIIVEDATLSAGSARAAL
jgi:hypothetical protein